MRKVFCLISLVLTTVALSLVAIALSVFNTQERNIHRLARMWARFHLRMCGITIRTEGLEHITAPPYIFMSNHQSALDIFALLSSLPLSFKWVAKRELFRIPFLGWGMKRAGYVSIDRNHPREALKAVDSAARKITEGMTIIIFPEGTRSHDGRLLPFKKGVFSLARRAPVPLVPVGIRGSHTLQPKGAFLPRGKGVIYIRIGEPLTPSGESKPAKTDLMLEVRERIQRLME